MIKKIWTDPVGSKLIAATIISIIGVLVTYFAGLWPAIKNSLLGILNFLGSNSIIPNWLLIIFLIPVLLFALALFDFIRRRFIGEKGNKPTFLEYRSDYFLEITWKWDYLYNSEISNLHALCPHCKYQIIPKFDTVGFQSRDNCILRCEDCGYSAAPFFGLPQDLIKTVTMKIQKNLRTGEWKNRVNKLGSAIEA